MVPDTRSSKASAPHSGLEEVSETPSPTPLSPEQENRKFELTGNPVYGPSYKVRKSGKRIADFALATHDTPGETKYWRIRAFDDLAERVRDTMRPSQTGVEDPSIPNRYLDRSAFDTSCPLATLAFKETC